MNRGVSRFLFIGPDHPTAMGGREQLARLHREVLGELVPASGALVIEHFPATGHSSRELLES